MDPWDGEGMAAFRIGDSSLSSRGLDLGEKLTSWENGSQFGCLSFRLSFVFSSTRSEFQSNLGIVH